VGIEHFGQRLSALARLGGSGVSYVKLDRAFCVGARAQPGQRAFVRAIVDVAHATGMLVIAEGLDDEHDLTALEALGIAGATGPLVSRTVDAATH